MGLSYCQIRDAAQKVVDWCAGIDVPWSTSDLDEQTLDINKPDLEISNGNSVPLDQLGVRKIYRYTPPATPGESRARWWLDTAGPHLDPLEWTGPADPVSGFPLPTTAPPDYDQPTTATNISDSTSGPGASRYGMVDGWIWLPPETTHIRDNNGNTGELGMVLLGNCCGGALVEQPGGNHTTSTGGTDRTLMDPTPAIGGWYYRVTPSSDSSALSGEQLQYSTDNTASWNNVTVRQIEKPTVECVEVLACDPIPEGWQIEPLAECCQPTYQAPGGLNADDVQALIDATPHPDPVATTCEPNHLRTYAGFQGQVFPITATNFNDQILGWLPTPSFTAECDGYVSATLEQPWTRTGVRDSFAQIYVDVRLLVNGTPVETRTNYTLLEHWWPDQADNNVDWRQHSFTWHTCRNVSAGDVLTLEYRYKARVTRNTGPSTYTRLLVYRESAVFENVPGPVVTDVTHA